MTRTPALYIAASWPLDRTLDWDAGQARVGAIQLSDLVESRENASWRHWVAWDEDLLELLQPEDQPVPPALAVEATRTILAADLDAFERALDEPDFDATTFVIENHVVVVSGGWPRREDDWPTTTAAQLSRLHGSGVMAAIGIDRPAKWKW